MLNVLSVAERHAQPSLNCNLYCPWHSPFSKKEYTFRQLTNAHKINTLLWVSPRWDLFMCNNKFLGYNIAVLPISALSITNMDSKMLQRLENIWDVGDFKYITKYKVDAKCSHAGFGYMNIFRISGIRSTGIMQRQAGMHSQACPLVTCHCSQATAWPWPKWTTRWYW